MERPLNTDWAPYREHGSWFRLNGGILECAPMHADDGTFDPEEAGAVAFDLIDEDQAEKMKALRDRLVAASTHEKDEDCDVDPETDCCRACGVYHGDPCPSCGGAGFHRACPFADGDA